MRRLLALAVLLLAGCENRHEEELRRWEHAMLTWEQRLAGVQSPFRDLARKVPVTPVRLEGERPRHRAIVNVRNGLELPIHYLYVRVHRPGQTGDIQYRGIHWMEVRPSPPLAPGEERELAADGIFMNDVEMDQLVFWAAEVRGQWDRVLAKVDRTPEELEVRGILDRYRAEYYQRRWLLDGTAAPE